MQQIDTARGTAQLIVDNVKRVIIGKEQAIELGVIALMCQGHALIEDVPGVGKTMLARSLARSAGCSFKRIQFTPDLLPTDVTGVSIFNQRSGEFEFRQGPIIAQLVLADEINRATPKTQSATLEAMEERQVTVEGITHSVPTPFMVMATQNPIEYEGTFPLPEAQLDRFFVMISLGYPSAEEEIRVINGQQVGHPIENLQSVTSAEEIQEMQRATREVYVDDLIKEYIVTIISATRGHPDIALGASPRGSLFLFRGAQALALIRGRDYVLPDDVKELVVPIMRHRIIVSAAARMRGVDPAQVVREIAESIPVPGAQAQAGLGADIIYETKAYLLGRFYLIVLLCVTTVITGAATGFGLFYRLFYILGLTLILGYIWNAISLKSLEVSVDRRTRRVRVGDNVEERHHYSEHEQTAQAHS